MRIFIYECITAGGLGAVVSASLRAEGWAMLSAIVADFLRLPGIEVTTLLSDQCPDTVGHVCTRVSGADELAQFRGNAAHCDATLVIAPEFDDLLYNRSQMVLDANRRLLGSSPAAIRLTGDKWATACAWGSRGVPHPPTERHVSTACARLELPWVLKPRFGAGSQATFLIRDREEVASITELAFQEWPGGEFLIQQYVRGTSASVSFLVGPELLVPLVPARQHLSDDGRFRYQGGSLPLPLPLAERAIRLARQAIAGIDGLRGYVGVDLVLGEREDGAGDYAMEINPRLTTSYVGLRQLCRQNLADLMLRCVQGEKFAEPTWREGYLEFAALP